jgi:hypothetical protein
MTIGDLIGEMEKYREGSKESLPQYSRFMNAETRAAREMARAGVWAVRVGDTFYVRYNSSFQVYTDVPEASCVACADL